MWPSYDTNRSHPKLEAANFPRLGNLASFREEHEREDKMLTQPELPSSSLSRSLSLPQDEARENRTQFGECKNDDNAMFREVRIEIKKINRSENYLRPSPLATEKTNRRWHGANTILSPSPRSRFFPTQTAAKGTSPTASVNILPPVARVVRQTSASGPD